MKDKNIIITSLNEGMIVKNYKEMCKLLNQSPTTGEARQNQIKNWERYFSYEKIGQKFIINEIYKEPMNVEQREYRRGIYIKFIEIILQHILASNPGNCITITKQQLLYELGMVNNKYKHIPLSLIKLETKNNNITNSDLNNFYSICDSRLSHILSSSLENLTKRRLIDYSIQKIIVKKNKAGKELEYIIASEIELDIIRNLERDTLDIMQLDNMDQVRKMMKFKEFYRVRNKLAAEEYKWIAIYDRYKIQYTSDRIVENLKIDKEELKTTMKELNNKVVTAINKTTASLIKRQHKKSDKLLEQYNNQYPSFIIGSTPQRTKEELNIFDYNTEFGEHMQQLTNLLIMIK